MGARVQLSLLGATALYQYLVKLGLGKPMTTLALDDRRSLLILGIIARTLLLNPSTALAKISFASTLMRFSYAERMRQFLWLMIASVSILMVFHVIFPWLACVPFWKRVDDKTDGGCYLAAYDSVVFGSSVFFGLTDIALALLPWRLLFFPELKRWERLGVVVAMSLGALCVSRPDRCQDGFDGRVETDVEFVCQCRCPGDCGKHRILASRPWRPVL